MTAKKAYTKVGVVSMRIRALLKRHGLQKCKVKVLSSLKEVVKPKDLEKVYDRCKSRETDKTVYYVQEFRVTCEDEDYSAVLEFLRTDEYKIRNILIKDIQLSTDYAGSRAGARTLTGGGGCIFIYSGSARLVSFVIKLISKEISRT